jgi:hypothetical protein
LSLRRTPPIRLRHVTSISGIEVDSWVVSLRSDACSINPVFPAGDLIEIKFLKFAARVGRYAVHLPALMNIKAKVRARRIVDGRKEMSDAILFRHTRQTCYP